MTQDSPARSASLSFRVAVSLAVGAVIGFALSSVAGPSIIGWWYAPPIKDAFSCASSVRSALQQFVTMQLISAGIGAVILALIVFLVSRSRHKAPAASSV
jgi:L-cystine uptake protein TcyP (sodium:dicarboxylate symporter family)